MGEVARIDDVFVAASHRRQGIGRAMMGRILDICTRALFRQIMLCTLPDNEPAQHLYRSLGFEKIGQVTAHFAPGLALKTD